jgi:hypothetical protein
MKALISKMLRSPRVLIALAGKHSIGVIAIAVAMVVLMPFLVGYGLLEEDESFEDIFRLINLLLGPEP